MSIAWDATDSPMSLPGGEMYMKQTITQIHVEMQLMIRIRKEMYICWHEGSGKIYLSN